MEIQGGIFSRGAHFRPAEYNNDCIKHNAAVALGWRLLWYTPVDLDRHPKAVVRQVRSLLEQGKQVEIDEQQELFA